MRLIPKELRLLTQDELDIARVHVQFAISTRDLDPESMSAVLLADQIVSNPKDDWQVSVCIASRRAAKGIVRMLHSRRRLR